jgi:hypothetical protein
MLPVGERQSKSASNALPTNAALRLCSKKSHGPEHTEPVKVLQKHVFTGVTEGE